MLRRLFSSIADLWRHRGLLRQFTLRNVELRHADLVWLPVLLLPVLLAAYRLALGLGALGVFWRDVAQIVQFVSFVLLFASAVFYPLSKIPSEAWLVLKYNPLLLTNEAARGVVFWDRPVNLVHLGYLYAFGTTACLVGAPHFLRLRGSFTDAL